MPSDSYTLTISSLGVAAAHAASHASSGSDPVSISATQVTSGTLPVARGGTGAATLTGYVKGTGTTAMTASAMIPVGDLSGSISVPNGGTGAATLTGYVKGTGTTAMTASGTVPVGDISGTLPVNKGGTGAATLTGYVKADGTNVMTASGTVPVGDISGTLPVNKGGTGAATLTGYVKADGTNAMTASNSVPATDISGNIPVSIGGTGAVSITGSGNNVLATSPTLVTPVLGTPAAGSFLDNCTGLPIGAGTTGILPADRLPAPTPTTLGGVKRNAGASGTVVSGIGSDGSLLYVAAPSGGGGGGGISSFIFTDGSGFAGSVTLATSTPTLSLTVTPTGILKGAGGALVSAVSGTDYAPATGSAAYAPATGSTVYAPTAGSGSIVTVGTITAGVWNGTAIAVARGGTGATDAANARTNLSVPSATGTGASGTWGISVSGNAATATTLQTARSITLSGDVSGTASFNGSADATITGTIVSASDTVAGKVELATQAEVNAGIDTSRAVTPATIASRYVTKTGDTMTGPLAVKGVSLTRSDTTSEGGEITFRRAEDDASAWSIDQLGAGVVNGGSLRFIELTGTVNIPFALSKTAATFTVPVTASSFIGDVTGNASTATNGVVTSTSYANPAFITSIAASKLTGSVSIAQGGTGAATAAAAVTNLTTIEVISGVSYTLSNADSGKILRTTSEAAVTIIVPVGLSSNFSVMVIQGGGTLGVVTFSASGTTIQSFGNLFKTAGQFAAASLLRVDTNIFNLSGNLA